MIIHSFSWHSFSSHSFSQYSFNRLSFGVFFATAFLATAFLATLATGCTSSSQSHKTACTNAQACQADEVCVKSFCDVAKRCTYIFCEPFQLCEENIPHTNAKCLNGCESGYNWNSDTLVCDISSCSTGGCACTDDAACEAGYRCSDSTCVAVQSCGVLNCGNFRKCQTQLPHADARCLEECVNGYSWQSTTSTCEQTTCSSLGCTALNRRCDTANFQCAECLGGYLEDLVTAECRPPIKCRNLTCNSGESCIEASANNIDARCVLGRCPANSIEIGNTGRCAACAPCDSTLAGEDGPYMASATLEDKCICKTLPGFYWQEGNSPGVRACDADGDGWIRESAKNSLEKTSDAAIITNARCALRRIASITLRDDTGGEHEEPLPQIIPLYETDRNDDDTLLALATSTGDVLPYGDGGRTLRAKELNSFTKACINLRGDYNENNIADIEEWQESSALSTVKPTFLPYIDFSYFLETHRGWYRAGTGNNVGTYVISEKSRANSNDSTNSIKVIPPSADGNYWRTCERLQDADYLPLQQSGEPALGMDFARYSPNATWRGMTHHSQFKCVVVVDQTSGDANKLTVPQLLNQNYTMNRCSVPAAAGSNGVPSGVSELVNPSDPIFTCRTTAPEMLSNGYVGMAIIGYRNYETSLGYKNGCVNECMESPQLCPGWQADGSLNRSVCDGDLLNYGQIICGCGKNYGGVSCEIGCDDASLLTDPSSNPVVRSGYWMCSGVQTTTYADTASSAFSDLNTGYAVTGSIPTRPTTAQFQLCENNADCSAGYILNSSYKPRSE